EGNGGGAGGGQHGANQRRAAARSAPRDARHLIITERRHDPLEVGEAPVTNLRGGALQQGGRAGLRARGGLLSAIPCAGRGTLRRRRGAATSELVRRPGGLGGNTGSRPNRSSRRTRHGGCALAAPSLVPR